MVDVIDTRLHQGVVGASRASCAMCELHLVLSNDSYRRHHHHFLRLPSRLTALRPNANSLLIFMQSGFEVQVGAVKRGAERKQIMESGR